MDRSWGILDPENGKGPSEKLLSFINISGLRMSIESMPCKQRGESSSDKTSFLV